MSDAFGGAKTGNTIHYAFLDKSFSSFDNYNSDWLAANSLQKQSTRSFICHMNFFILESFDANVGREDKKYEANQEKERKIVTSILNILRRNVFL